MSMNKNERIRLLSTCSQKELERKWAAAAIDYVEADTKEAQKAANNYMLLVDAIGNYLFPDSWDCSKIDV